MLSTKAHHQKNKTLANRTCNTRRQVAPCAAAERTPGRCAAAQENCTRPLYPSTQHPLRGQGDRIVTRACRKVSFPTPNYNSWQPDSSMLHAPTTAPAATSVHLTGRPGRALPRSGRHTAVPCICPYDNCGRAFIQPSDLKRHLRIHTGEKPFTCPHEDCGKSFALLTTLTRHFRTHSGEKPYVCSYENCGRAFTQLSTLKSHIRTHTREKPFRCPYPGCISAFATSSRRIKHRRTHSGEKPFRCTQTNCEKAFTQSAHLKRHRRIHSAAYIPCPREDCGYLSTQPDNLKQHWRVHSGDKPYVCTQEGCTQIFAHASNLTRHLRTHWREKPFVCPYGGCGHLFAYQTSLTRHAHTHSPGRKSFFCPWEGCAHVSGQPDNLKRHLYTHTGEKPFVCPRQSCGYAATHPANLKRHMNVHAGAKRFVCPRQGCEYATTHPANLTRHRNAHSGEKPFVCPRQACAKKFGQFSHMKRHLDTHTKARSGSDALKGSKKRIRKKRGLPDLTGSPNAESARSRSRADRRPPVQTPGHAMHWPLHRAKRSHRCHYPECNRCLVQVLALKMHRHRHTGLQACIGSARSGEPEFAQKRSLQAPVSPPAEDGSCRLVPARLPVRHASPLTIHQCRRTGTGPCPGPDSQGDMFTKHKNHKPQDRHRTRKPEAGPARLRHAPRNLHRPPAKAKASAAAGPEKNPSPLCEHPTSIPVCRQPGMKRDRRGTPVKRHNRHGVAPALPITSPLPASRYCSVIAWVSGGVVVKSTPQEK